MAAHRASVSGSLVGRFAFIGKSVRGRLTVSFHSGMGIQLFYDERMRSTIFDNGLKVLIQEEHTAPLASVWCWYKVGSKDERPVRPGRSSFDPTLYQHQTDASGAVCSSWMRTLSPLSKIVERMRSS